MSRNEPLKNAEEDATDPGITCTLSQEQFENRPEEVRALLVDRYKRTEELDTGYCFYFEGTDQTLVAAAVFLSNELKCCSFGEYRLSVSPPYKETKLVITGPDGTKNQFQNLPELLEKGTNEFSWDDV